MIVLGTESLPINITRKELSTPKSNATEAGYDDRRYDDMIVDNILIFSSHLLLLLHTLLTNSNINNIIII